MKTISRDQYLQLTGLLSLAQRHGRQVEEVRTTVMGLLGISEGTSAADHVTEAIFEGRSAEKLMAHLGIPLVFNDGIPPVELPESWRNGEERDRVFRALEESVRLQSHYAKLLNMHDGGERIVFDSSESWLRRLDEVGVQDENPPAEFARPAEFGGHAAHGGRDETDAFMTAGGRRPVLDGASLVTKIPAPNAGGADLP
jgi:hypothetical protein